MSQKELDSLFYFDIVMDKRNGILYRLEQEADNCWITSNGFILKENLLKDYMIKI